MKRGFFKRITGEENEEEEENQQEERRRETAERNREQAAKLDRYYMNSMKLVIPLYHHAKLTQTSMYLYQCHVGQLCKTHSDIYVSI